jgi:hypothetical protein
MFPMTDEFYSADDLRGFQKVGEFLSWFARLEMQMDLSITALLGIEQTAGRLLLSYIPFSRKAEFLSKLIDLDEVGFTKEEKKAARERLGMIQDKGRTRNTIAHSFFTAESGRVKFMNATKTMSDDNSETVDDEAFWAHRTEMADLWGWLAQITARIQKKVGEKRLKDALLKQLEQEARQPFSNLH